MSEKLAALVERCGVYNPGVFKGVVYSHRKISFGGKIWHILTRICPTGSDYTGRENYLAHHLVLDSSEAGGLSLNSAEILLGWKGWVSSWGDGPKWLEGSVYLGDAEPAAVLPARCWKEETGDSGSAALFGSAPVSAVSDSLPPEKILGLFAESLKLFINTPDSWDVTFTTHFFEGDSSSDFTWKILSSGRAESLQTAINFDEKKFPPPPSNRSATYARTGVMNNREMYNLKVGAPRPSSEIRFKVQREEPEKKFFAWYIALGALIVVSMLAAYLVVASGSGGISVEDDFRAVPEKRVPSVSLLPLESMDVVRAKIDEALAGQKFEKAVSIWRESGFSENDPGYEKRLLSRIGVKIDDMLDDASELSDGKEAEVLVEKAVSAIKNLGIPRGESRIDRAKSIMEKFKK